MFTQYAETRESSHKIRPRGGVSWFWLARHYGPGQSSIFYTDKPDAVFDGDDSNDGFHRLCTNEEVNRLMLMANAAEYLAAHGVRILDFETLDIIIADNAESDDDDEEDCDL